MIALRSPQDYQRSLPLKEWMTVLEIWRFPDCVGWLSVILPAFRISHKLTYTHVAHTLFSRKRACTHICTTCTDSDACPDSTLHTQIHTYRSSLLWGTGVCVLLQAQVSGQQEQLTCLILSVMLFLHWQRNTLSVPLTLRGRALSLSHYF